MPTTTGVAGTTTDRRSPPLAAGHERATVDVMTTQPLPTQPRPLRAARELLLLVALYAAYSLARTFGDGDVAEATRHAQSLLGLEQALHIDVEMWANRALHDVPLLAVLASYWYAALHYLVTPALLVTVYRRAPEQYRRVRNTLVTGSAIGLVGFTLLPMAPPRMLPGYVDTLASTSGSGWWGGDASAPKGLGSLTNELAAMPSLHVGWAFWCAWVVYLLTRDQRLRRAGLAYAAGTALVVVVTANHYVLDGVAGVAVMAVGWAVATLPARRRAAVPAPVSVQGQRVVEAWFGQDRPEQKAA